MKFELNGRTFFTETKRITRTWIREKRDNGQVMTCVFNELPYNATEKEIMEFMIARGAKVVDDAD